MSKTQEKRRDAKIHHAEFVWARAQLTAAAMQEAHMHAVGVVQEHKDALTEEQDAEIQVQIKARQQQIEDYLMGARDEYLKRLEQA